MPASTAPVVLTRRLTRLLARFGVTVPVNRAGQTALSVTVRVSPMSSATRSAWFTFAESEGWAGRPAWTVTVPGDFRPWNTDPAATDTVTIGGVVCLIRKYDRIRLGETVVRTVLYCAP